MNFIVDINQDQFLDEVIEKSKTTPVVVDFWAPAWPMQTINPYSRKKLSQKKVERLF